MIPPIWRTVLFAVSLCLLSRCERQPACITYPYSQWTIGTQARNVTWSYGEDVPFNSSFIKAPPEGAWDAWYQQICRYRDTVRMKLGLEPPVLRCTFPSHERTQVHFDQFAYQLRLEPGESISIRGSGRSPSSSFTLYVGYDLKTRGEETGYVVRRRIMEADSIRVASSAGWALFEKTVTVPPFPEDSMSIAPVITIRCPQEKQTTEVLLKDIRLSVPANPAREKLLARVQDYLKRFSAQRKMEIPAGLSWNEQNFVMGFVFIWDTDFWDPESLEYRVDHYCRKMEREFGGIQSVVLWHSYPNLGIDEKNQFDFIDRMPGGREGLRKVVAAFHRNRVRVFITYNPWDLDTRRPAHHDFRELAAVINDTGADGIYLDTWRSSRGVISIYASEKSIRDEVAASGRTVAFVTEILPGLKDLVGPDALTGSWGQEIEPYHYTDLSHLKWLMPEHKQYFIRRMTGDRKPMLTHAWINGQGIQVWEDVFGTMNPWNAGQRQQLRKMNAIWHIYGNMYLTDHWEPLIPVPGKPVLASRWHLGENTITNYVDTTRSVHRVTVRVDPGPDQKYFDLWNGRQLFPVKQGGYSTVLLTIRDFGCLLQTSEETASLTELLNIQARETARIPGGEDPHVRERSLKEPWWFYYDSVQYPTNPDGKWEFSPELLLVKGGEHTFTCTHMWREGGCYPDRNAVGNHDYNLVHEDGALRIIHSHTDTIGDFMIMPEVVTNGQFEMFLRSSDYRPVSPEYFLHHWNDSTCPEQIRDQPVVYVSLEDARAFAAWAGMQLPSEWEWQLAAQQLDTHFKFNEVFEWNESERYDGHNRFVTLRGGCGKWVMQSSWWYLPGAPYGEPVGGARRFDAHVKYFLMFPGLDRASTIGFRCISK
jgi:iron(II)-dependent oxidoreductase